MLGKMLMLLNQYGEQSEWLDVGLERLLLDGEIVMRREYERGELYDPHVEGHNFLKKLILVDIVEGLVGLYHDD